MIRHVDPATLETTAIAPYNFIPLPAKVLEVEDGIPVGDGLAKPWEQHDRYVPGTFTGWIDLDIETLSPLFIRGPVRRDGQGQWDLRDARLRPEPFLDRDGRPLIPGSSLRGMLRNLYEIVSFSKIPGVSRDKPFYRSLANDRMGLRYRSRFLSRGGAERNGRPGTRIRAGVLMCGADGEWAVKEFPLVRVPTQQSQNPNMPPSILDLPAWTDREGRPSSGANCIPNPRLQYSIVQVQVEGSAGTGPTGKHDSGTLPRRVSRLEWKPFTGSTEAMLIVTGWAQKKHFEFALMTGEPSQGIVSIPEKVWKRFHDADQISRWQEDAFPKGQSRLGRRERKGVPIAGEPVFFLHDGTQLEFFGRAQMFRLPYDLGPWDLLPDEHKATTLDMAEALFGRVPQGAQSETRALKGRLRVADARAVQGPGAAPSDWIEPRPFVPHILASPKTTAYQLYLTQDAPRGIGGLTSYLAGDRTTIRGFKLYWHRRCGIGDVQRMQDMPQHDTQSTLIRPIKIGVRFSGRIDFDNLTPVELGALWECLSLPDGHAHKLGMGKPLGLGSVRIRPTLHLYDLQQRYSGWASGDVAPDAERDEMLKAGQAAFASFLDRHASASGETRAPGGQGLRAWARLDALYLMLQWEGQPDRARTRYMTIQPNEYKSRSVLPTPHRLFSGAAFEWAGDRPSAGNAPPPSPKAPAGVAARGHGAAPARPPAPQPPPPPPRPVPKVETGEEVWTGAVLTWEPGPRRLTVRGKERTFKEEQFDLARAPEAVCEQLKTKRTATVSVRIHWEGNYRRLVGFEPT